MEQNLMDVLLSEMNRVRGLITEYESLPKGAGMFGSTMMKQQIEISERSISSGDIVSMMLQCQKLKAFTS